LLLTLQALPVFAPAVEALFPTAKKVPKKAVPRSQDLIRKHEAALVTPSFCGCCGTRTERVLRWGKINQKIKSKSGFDFDSPLPSEQAEE